MSSPPRMTPAIAAEIDRLATAVAKDPRSKDFLPLADEYIKAGMWQEAAAVLEDGLKVYPGFVTAMVALGRVYDQVGQPAKAKTILEDVVKQRSDNLRAHRILAKLYQGEGQAELALRSCEAILNANPFDEEALAVKRGLTGVPDEASPATSGKKPRVTDTTASKLSATGSPISAPESFTSTASPTEGPSHEPASAPPVVRHAAAIARLETWLGTIRARRHPAH